MKTSSLESKTIRPGLYTRTFNHRDAPIQHVTAKVVTNKKTNKIRRNILFLLLLALIGFASYSTLSDQEAAQQVSKAPIITSPATSNTIESPKKSTPVAATPVNRCVGNELPQFVVISITERHLWACEGTKKVRDYPVITGMQKIPDNATPPGTYKIYAKQRDTVLSGTASTGSWSEPVSYWMPFLDNNFGTYGFHDASWRKTAEFGNTDPNSDKGSHGCVQLGVASTKWLYEWAEVGTTVSIYL